MSKRLLASFAVLGLVASLGGTAIARDHTKQARRERAAAYTAIDDNHGTSEGHLPASKENMRLISRLKLTDIPGGVSDVNYLKGFAYVGKYSPACVSNSGTGAGVSVVDVRNPKAPREVAFIRAGADAYVSEGVHALKVDTPFFEGSLLLHSNESCGLGEAGGISIYDVNNPARPKQLVDQFGDTDANDPEDPTPLEFPNAVHSVMGWADGRHAYAVAVDNFEALDVDIFDISDPANPVLVRETGLPDWEGQISPQLAHGESAFIHDMWVKKIDGQWMMLISYWDAGWVLLNVDDPANPVFVTDSDYAAEDPQVPGFTPEGNAHQAAWSANNRFIVGTDEDFAPNRTKFFIESGDNAGEYPGGEFGW
ncbi:MAG: LVIVD repeat-containing protein, partial [Actinomycetota bacterium]